ncbi:CvpA family protein [Gluconobacter wancherniae]|uniref:Bacteriocin production protein n=1 Tax=Gluconobacter wancherniae NBRC 103581 TaxID=656744 RepID=A0A511AYY9_9PROT|nr:CvpA family protein [Gluconobacter wancherniae]MBF0852693.1 CvpA family protein [Gluconobacter wancherniae]GBD56595.1 colicin V biosynthesis protein [Gluconobacter wancherniae NBRC 103581]GBR64172.1 colicin V production protein [Gluconobacter wancherniae NBRC 103581]GEK92503.1 bacteriocin production protein [Gluconobacter wancherniae NBRC 103581]
MPDFSQFSIDSLTRMDIAALVVLGMSALWGLTRGLATELSGLVAWVAAVLLALRYHAVLEPFLSSYIKESWLLSGASDLIVFVVLLLFFSSIAARVGNAARNSLLGGVDRILGAAFGVLRGYFVLVALYLLAETFFGSLTSYLTHGSVIAPYIVAGATHLVGYLPHFMQPHLASPVTSGHDATL